MLLAWEVRTPGRQNHHLWILRHMPPLCVWFSVKWGWRYCPQWENLHIEIWSNQLLISTQVRLRQSRIGTKLPLTFQVLVLYGCMWAAKQGMETKLAASSVWRVAKKKDGFRKEEKGSPCSQTSRVRVMSGPNPILLKRRLISGTIASHSGNNGFDGVYEFKWGQITNNIAKEIQKKLIQKMGKK